MSLSSKKQYLVVGGTGMLAPLCQSLPPSQLIIAARFVSNQSQVQALKDDVMTVTLDYQDDTSKVAFLDNLSHWHHLKYCILWIHSNAHEFSHQIIRAVSKLDTPPQVIHIFGTNIDDSQLLQYAKSLGVSYSSVKLGHVDTASGWRWLTHDEISQQVIDILE